LGIGIGVKKKCLWAADERLRWSSFRSQRNILKRGNIVMKMWLNKPDCWGWTKAGAVKKKNNGEHVSMIYTSYTLPIRVKARLYIEGVGLRLSRQPIARVIGKILFLTYAIL
jgi:hypothetical protein